MLDYCITEKLSLPTIDGLNGEKEIGKGVNVNMYLSFKNQFLVVQGG